MFPNPFRFSQICLAPDAGGGMGADAAPNTDPAQDPVLEQEKPDEVAVAQDPPAAEGQPEQKQHEEKHAHSLGNHSHALLSPAQEGEHKRNNPAVDFEAQLATSNARLAEAQLRSAAALAGVPKGRIAYAMRMADVSGIDPLADDAADKYAAAIDKVLSDVPELRGSAGGTGSTGNFARKTGEPEAPDLARIRKNILG